MEQYHRATAEQFITAKHLENTWNSITAETVITDTTVITAITCNSRADTTAITWNGITVKQLSQIKQDNS